MTDPQDPGRQPDPYAELADLAGPVDPDAAAESDPAAADQAPKLDPYAELADLDSDPAQKADPYAGLADLDPDPTPKADPYGELAGLAPEPEPKPDPYAGLADLAPAPDPGASPGAPTASPDGPSAEPAGPETQTLWHGRFTGGPADELMAFTVSLPFDRRLALDDLAGSRAHVAGLSRAEILTDLEATEIQVALDQVEQELVGGDFAFVPSDEDIHTAIERRVTELAGDTGAKLHTGRSRNDQVATALRLWCRRELDVVAQRVVDLQHVLLDRAREAGGTYLPGYTHLQRAQPVLLSHHLLAHGWALSRDVDRLRDCRRRLDVSPLGAGALAGSSLPLDPAFTAAQLGFGRPFDNSLDAVSDRDFVAEALFALSLLAVHLSRMGEEIVLWTSEEFGFAHLDDAYATGSSMLPQKKNADIAELARGKAGRAIGNLTGLLATLKGLPLAYNRDLQEDKEPLFDSIDQVRLALGAMAGLYRTVTFVPKTMQAAADEPSLAATDLAEWLVGQGIPFRRAHAVVGELVRRSIDQGQALEDLVALHPDLGPEPARLIGPGQAVRRRTSPGAAGPAAVAPQLERFADHLESLTKPPIPEPEPVPAVTPEPEPVPVATPEPAPVVTPEPGPGPKAGQVPGPEPAPGADAPGAGLVPGPAPVVTPEPGPGLGPEAGLVPDPAPAPGAEVEAPGAGPDAASVAEPEPGSAATTTNARAPLAPGPTKPAPGAPPPEGPESPESPEDVVEVAGDPEPQPEPEVTPPGELPQIGPLVSAFTAAATSALTEEPEKPEKSEKPDKAVSGEFDLSEFGQFVASFDLDKPPDDGKAEP